MFKIFIILSVLGVTFAAPSNVGIIGGNEVDISKQPWTVSLQHKYAHQCGGVLIAPNWVLTSAICLVFGDTADLNVRAGSSHASSGGETALVSRFTVHPDFSLIPPNNDIALMKLLTPITHVNASVATLPKAGESVPTGATVYLSGFGEEEPYKEVGNLREVTVLTVDRDYCRSVIGSEVNENMFCAGVPEGGRGLCNGDDGGPASIDGVVVGLGSFGGGCGLTGLPQVYTKVSNYIDWIKQVTGI